MRVGLLFAVGLGLAACDTAVGTEVSSSLSPGQAFRYTSFCPLATCWGTMEGHYRMRREDDGGEFDVAIGRFWLTKEKMLAGDEVE